MRQGDVLIEFASNHLENRRTVVSKGLLLAEINCFARARVNLDLFSLKREFRDEGVLESFPVI